MSHETGELRTAGERTRVPAAESDLTSPAAAGDVTFPPS